VGVVKASESSVRVIVSISMFLSGPLFAAQVAPAIRHQDAGDRMSHGRPFTIKDSIEMSFFVNPDMSGDSDQRKRGARIGPIMSPDRKYFLLITERGKLSSNQIESTIWLFNRKTVVDFVLKKSGTNPIPKALVTMAATSNMPVISGVRWLSNSREIAFLGKNRGPYQQLFTASVSTGKYKAVTKRGTFVSAYDVSGEVIAYTTLVTDSDTERQRSRVVDVTGQSIWSLLFAKRSNIESLQWEDFYNSATTLHIIRNGREVGTSFTLRGKPLRLLPSVYSLYPPLSLSPDGNSLITVAPVAEILPSWSSYQPGLGLESFRLKPGDKSALADENPFKPKQFVVVDLRNGRATPLVDAPAGLSLNYIAPAKAFWLTDNRRAVLCNTFLPLGAARDEVEAKQWSKSPAVALVDIRMRTIQPITYLDLPSYQAAKFYQVADISWDPVENEISMRYSGRLGGEVRAPDVFRLQSDRWIKISASGARLEYAPDGVQLSVDEALERPPVFVAHRPNESSPTVLWNPNPRLGDIALGRVSVYRWSDKNGIPRSGILALPPNYDSQRRFPLVIQTHGYDANKYFVDGTYTTGTGGRALTAKDIIVLQMDMPMEKFRTPNDGPFETDGFERAIDQLAKDGLVDSHRVGVVGFSYSCFHVLYTLTHFPKLFAAASITDGPDESYVQYVLSTDAPNGFREVSEDTNGGMPFGQNLLNWASRTPGFNLDKVEAPLLISALEKGQLLLMWEPYSGLRRLSKPVDMLWLNHEDATHVLVEPYHRYVSQQSAVDWFDFWLNGHEDPDPAKAEQYARWRQLRKLQQENEKKETEEKSKVTPPR
jgi:hypothetical protein